MGKRVTTGSLRYYILTLRLIETSRPSYTF
jgi:hypothetical protein